MTRLKVLSRLLSGENEKRYDNPESVCMCRVWDLIPGPIKHEGFVVLSTTVLRIGVRDAIGVFGEGYVANHGLSSSRYRFVNLPV